MIASRNGKLFGLTALMTISAYNRINEYLTQRQLSTLPKFLSCPDFYQSSHMTKFVLAKDEPQSTLV